MPLTPFAGDLTLGRTRVRGGMSDAEATAGTGFAFRKVIGGHWSARNSTGMFLSLDFRARRNALGKRRGKRVLTCVSVGLLDLHATG